LRNLLSFAMQSILVWYNLFCHFFILIPVFWGSYPKKLLPISMSCIASPIFSSISFRGSSGHWLILSCFLYRVKEMDNFSLPQVDIQFS
jgi:hypothetical protein